MYQPQTWAEQGRSLKKEMLWSVWKQMRAEGMLKHLKSIVFPQLASLANGESSFGEYMRGAECKINEPSMLVEAVNLIDPMKIKDLVGFHRTLLDLTLYRCVGCDGVASR